MVCEGQTLVNEQGSRCSQKQRALSQQPSTAGCQTGRLPARLRVPRGDGDLLIAPPVCDVNDAVERNRELFKQNEILAKRRKRARLEALEIARRYTASISPQQPPCSRCSIEELAGEKPFYLTGHQPELFHPGVWVKNVLIAELAKRNHGISLNVIIDSDAVKSHSIKIPVQQNGRIVQKRIIIDHWPPGVPWEELSVVDRELFESLATRVEQQDSFSSPTTVLPDFWRAVVSEVDNSGSVVKGLVTGRVQLERKLGINNYEVPISLLVDSAGYRNFLAELIFNANRLLEIYNKVLREYRKCHHIKTAMQPVPDLLKRDGWNELPIWVWNGESKRRRSLFVKSEAGKILLSDHAGWQSCMDIESNSDAQPDDCFRFISAHLHQLQQQGMRLRTKALMTTAYLRLFVADWFIHGIGGAKYDEITDSIIADFWNIPTPQFQVATGTLWMPLENRPAVPTQSSAQLKQQFRHAVENPETVLTAAERESAADLLKAKKELIAQQKQAKTEGLSRTQRRAKAEANRKRYQELKQVRESLLQIAAPRIKQLQKEIEQTIQIERDLQAANGREYPLCCYPLESLKNFAEEIRR